MNTYFLRAFMAAVVVTAMIAHGQGAFAAGNVSYGINGSTTAVKQVDDEGEKQEGEEPEEGEAPTEGEPPAEGESPTEGETPVEPGWLAGVSLVSPVGAVVAESGAVETAPQLLVAQVEIQDGDLDPEGVTVLFAIDDMAHQAAWHEAGFFFLAVSFPTELPPDEEGEGEAPEGSESDEGEGEPVPVYSVQVIAYGEEEGDYVESPVYEIIVLTADDLDDNGFADNPFVALPEGGDTWLSAIEGDVCARVVAMKSMLPGPGYTPLFVQNPEEPDQIAGVWAPNALILPEEYGILIVAAACAPEELYAPYDTSVMTASEPGRLPVGGMYTDISIIVSRDQGSTFSEVTPLRLASNPIIAVFNRIESRDGFQNIFHGYPTMVDSDLIGGVRVIPMTGQWSEEGVTDASASTAEGMHTVNLSRLHVLAPFEMPYPGELHVEPDPATGYNFGVVKVDHPKTGVFTLTNIGGESMQCDIEFEDESGVFFLQGDTQIILEPEEKWEIKVQFNPAAAEEYEGMIIFYGGENSPQKMALTGRGALENKSIRPLGCGVSERRAAADFADVLLAVITVALLAWRGKRISCSE